MVKNTRTLLLGFFIIIIPFLGFTRFWKNSFLVLIGLYLIVLSVKITLPKKGVSRRIKKKERTTPVFTENSPIEIPKIEQTTDTDNPSSI